MLLAGDVENWAEQFSGDQWASEFARAAGTAAGVGGPRTRQEGYQFAADNPYTDDADSFAKVSADRIAVSGGLQHAPRGCRTLQPAKQDRRVGGGHELSAMPIRPSRRSPHDSGALACCRTA